MLIIKKKRICRLFDFAAPVNHKVKMKESEKIDKYLEWKKKTQKVGKKTVQHEIDSDTNNGWCPWNGP